MGAGTIPPRFLPRRIGRARSSRSSLLLVFSCSSSVSSESSDPLSSPAPAPLWLDAEVCVPCGGGEGDGEGELRESRETVELGIAYGGEEAEDKLGEEETQAPNPLTGGHFAGLLLRNGRNVRRRLRELAGEQLFLKPHRDHHDLDLVI